MCLLFWGADMVRKRAMSKPSSWLSMCCNALHVLCCECVLMESSCLQRQMSRQAPKSLAAGLSLHCQSGQVWT